MNIRWLDGWRDAAEGTKRAGRKAKVEPDTRVWLAAKPKVEPEAVRRGSVAGNYHNALSPW